MGVGCRPSSPPHTPSPCFRGVSGYCSDPFHPATHSHSGLCCPPWGALCAALWLPPSWACSLGEVPDTHGLGSASGKEAGLEEQPPLSLFSQVCKQTASQEGPLCCLPATCWLTHCLVGLPAGPPPLVHARHQLRGLDLHQGSTPFRPKGVPGQSPGLGHAPNGCAINTGQCRWRCP